MFKSTKKFSALISLVATIAFAGSVFAAASTKPTVSGFKASASLFTYSGGSLTLTATVKNATKCIFTVKPLVAGFAKTINCSNGRVTYKTTLPKNSSTKNTIYAFKLVVTGKKGMGSVAAPLRDVIVDAPPQPVIKSFTSTPAALANTGGTVTLSGTVDNALSCNLSVIPATITVATIVPCSSAAGTLTTITIPSNTSSSNVSYTFRLTASGIASSASSTSVVTVSSTSTPVTTTTTTTLPPTVGNTVSVPAEPDALVAAGNNVWVASCSGNAVTEINNSTKQIINVINAPTDGFNCPDALAFDGTNIWVANKLGNSITEFNASTGSWIQTLSGSQILNPNALAFDGTNIWVSDDSQNGQVGSFISEFNASTGMAVRTINTPKNYKWVFGSPTCLALDGSGIWIADLGNTDAIEFNVNTGAYIRKTTGGPAISGLECVTYHSGYIWLSNFNSADAIEYNATTGTYVRTINNVQNPNQLIFTGSDLFITSENPVDSVREYNSAGTFLKTVAKSSRNLGKGISSIVVDGASLWTANYSNNSVTKYTL